MVVKSRVKKIFFEIFLKVLQMLRTGDIIYNVEKYLTNNIVLTNNVAIFTII